MSTPIRRVMTKNILSVVEGTSLFEAHQLMKEKRIRHLPVVTNQDVLIGILSQRDLNYVPDSKKLTVEMFMTSPVECVDVDSSLRKAIFLMLEKKISCFLVTGKQDEVCGIVTTDDLLWHLAHILTEEPEKTKENYSFNLIDKRTIGEIANGIANAGI